MLNKTYNIFYTDDDADDQEFFRDAVADISRDHIVYIQSRGDDLLALLATPPEGNNLIFLDVNMPEKDGLEVLKELKQLPHAKEIPVIMLSTSTDETIIKTSRKLGASLYIPKPTSYAEFRNIMKVLLHNGQNNNYFPTGDYIYHNHK